MSYASVLGSQAAPPVAPSANATSVAPASAQHDNSSSASMAPGPSAPAHGSVLSSAAPSSPAAGAAPGQKRRRNAGAGSGSFAQRVGNLCAKRRLENVSSADQEAIARGQEAAEQIVHDWLAKPEHNKCKGLVRAALRDEVAKALHASDRRDPEKVLDAVLKKKRVQLGKKALNQSKNTLSNGGDRLTAQESSEKEEIDRQVLLQHLVTFHCGPW